MAFRTSGLGTFYWSCCLDGLVTLSALLHPLEENCSVIYVYLSVVPWPWRVFPAFFFFFFKVKIGLAAEAITRNPQFL